MDYKRSRNNEPVIRQKSYIQEKYAKRKSSYIMKEISYYLGELMSISGWNLLISIILFIVLLLGTNALPYVMKININFGPETFWCRGGIFLSIAIVSMIILAVSGMGYGISGDLVKVKRIQNDVHIIGTRCFKLINRGLIVVQFILACICFYILIEYS